MDCSAEREFVLVQASLRSVRSLAAIHLVAAVPRCGFRGFNCFFRVEVFHFKLNRSSRASYEVLKTAQGNEEKNFPAFGRPAVFPCLHSFAQSGGSPKSLLVEGDSERLHYRDRRPENLCARPASAVNQSGSKYFARAACTIMNSSTEHTDENRFLADWIPTRRSPAG